jgi:hypothetical protein
LKRKNAPDGLVSNDNLAPVLDLVRNSLELLGNNADGLARLTLLQALAAAQNHTKTVVGGCLCLVGNEVVVLLEDLATLRVSDQGPGDAAVLELLSRDLAGKGSVGLVEDVLRCDLEALAEVLACEEEVEGWWCDNDLWLRVSFSCFANVMDLAPSWVAKMRFNVPVLGSSLALFRFSTMSVMLLIEPFLSFVSLSLSLSDSRLVKLRTS